MSNNDLTWQIHLSMVCLHNLFIPPIRKYALNQPLRSVAQLLIGLRDLVSSTILLPLHHILVFCMEVGYHIYIEIRRRATGIYTKYNKKRFQDYGIQSPAWLIRDNILNVRYNDKFVNTSTLFRQVFIKISF